MKKLILLFPFTLMVFLLKTVLAQEVADTPIVHDLMPKIYKNFLTTGRVIGLNLETLQGVVIIDGRTNEKTNTDSHGIYHLNAAKGDTLTFEFSRHSKELRVVKHQNEKLNVILIKRKVDELALNPSPSDVRKAKKADEELYNILEKDAKLEGKWNY